MGADRFYIQPVRRQHQELVPPWVRAQPHLIHRPVPKAPVAPEAPEVIRGTASGRGRVELPLGTALGGAAPRNAQVAVQNAATVIEPSLSGCWGAGGPGEHVAGLQPCPQLSTWGTDRRPACEQLFVVYKARSQACAVGRTSLTGISY